MAVTDSVADGREASPPTERSPLLANPKSPVDVSVASSATETGSIVDSSYEGTSSVFLRPDEEALIDGAQTPPVEAPVTDVKGGTARTIVIRIILVILIGVFVFNADGSLLLATHPVVASEFDALADSSWLITSFVLASAATQTLYGKLSDIYGRKGLIISSHLIFALGCGIVGVGQAMWQVVAGRAISGAGGAGVTVLVSILITDLLPMREVATWRAYVNVVATTGRSLGGPLGGWLSDVVGWRWSFIGQVPFMIVATILCWIYLPGRTKPAAQTAEEEESEQSSKKSRLARVDFIGSTLLALTLLAFLFPMELGGVKIPWSHPLVGALFATSAVLLALFILAEKRAKEPVVPLEIFYIRDAVLSFLTMMFQVAAQLGLMFSVPLYFKVTAEASNTEAGAHLFPAVVGNAVGGILSGLIIQKTGKYKLLIILATLSSSLGYLMLLLRWHGHTNWWESMYIIPGGFGTGIAQSAVFISLQAVIDPAHIAPAISVLYLSSTVAMTLGLSAVSAVMQGTLKTGLTQRLVDLGLSPALRSDILSKAISSVDYVFKAEGAVKAAVVESYVDSLWWSHAVSLIFSSLGLLCGLLMREKPLPKH